MLIPGAHVHCRECVRTLTEHQTLRLADSARTLPGFEFRVPQAVRTASGW